MSEPENLEPRRLTSRPSPLRLGGWVVEPEANELRGPGGELARVEPRAMDVLVLLHERFGEVVSTEEILDRVWGPAVVSPHSVAVVISELRRALGDSSRDPRYIQTVPKRGYRLLPPTRPAIRDAKIRSWRSSGFDGVDEAPRRPWRKMALGVSLVGLAVATALVSHALRPADPAARPVHPRLQEKLFLARQLWSRREPETAQQARRLLLEILAEREDFAPAHAALADLYTHKTGEYLDLAPLEAYRVAQRHVDRALALDPDHAAPYVSRALLEFNRDRQPRKALASLDRALELDPWLALAWQTRGMVLSVMGQDADALAAIERAGRLDPLSESIAWDGVWFRYVAGDFDAAFAALLETSRRSSRNLFYEALIEAGRGNHRRALEVWLERCEHRGERLADPAAIRALGATSLEAAYVELLGQHQGGAFREDALVTAIWRLQSGDPAGAVAELTAVEPGSDPWIDAWLHRLPVLAFLRDRPDMRALLRREGVVVADD